MASEIDSATDDAFASVSKWSDRGIACLVTLKKELDNVTSGSNYSNLRGDPGLRNRIKEKFCQFQRLSTTLDGIIDALNKGIDNLGRMCGIDLLPDEVLAAIFEMVVNTTGAITEHYVASCRWREAVSLSHINHRLRSIMLASPQLWTNMASSRQMAAACLPRTNGLPLNISMDADNHGRRDDWSFHPILAELFPVAQYWECLHLSISCMHPESRLGRNNFKFADLSDPPFYRLNAPLLEKLSIEYSCFVNGADTPHWDWSRWNTPNLRHLKTYRYFPISLPELISVTNLDLTMSIYDDHFPRTVKEISQMVNLRDFTVKFLDTDKFPRFIPMTEFPHIQQLKMKTTRHARNKGGKLADGWRPVFFSLFFPNLIHLQLDVEGKGCLSWGDETFYFNEEMNRIFSQANQYPKVQSFYLKIVSQLDYDGECKVPTELAIPLNMLPSLKDLTIQCNTRFDMVDDVESKEEVGDVLPILNTVTLDVLDASDVAKWLGEYLEEMKDRGKWDEFRELTIMERGGKDFQKTTYPRDKALKWCKDMIIRREKPEGPFKHVS
ncbi:hypothetical protein SCHPADRAFT_944742 [Schizopora paradoxa]|uniref:F-box domain-containing protein n=1 Tax=Schizopora paradoxa TaxID=27342 RepID=A0A0H2R9Q0_9AGAM|nr:hypothetical protein SCHPADRAFT_944742 [Schizopora paradoxa]